MKKILVIEDEMHIANLQREILTHSGYDVTHKEDGMDGYVEFMQNNYDCVITDIMMPVMDGKKLIDLIRATNKSVPIIVVSALDDHYSKERVAELGGTDYLEKPFSILDLTSLVAKYI